MNLTNDGDLLIPIRDFTGNEVYVSEAIRVEIHPDAFLQIKETLQRMGIYSPKTNTLWQSAHILHKKGRYFILHFKELLALDGNAVNFSPEDQLRRDYIVALLEKWNLLKICDQEVLLEVRSRINSGNPPIGLRVIRHSERDQVNLSSKYEMGLKIKK